jgi:hypothetical protein
MDSLEQTTQHHNSFFMSGYQTTTTLHYTMLQFLIHSCLLVRVYYFTVLQAWLILSDYLSKRKLVVHK